MSKQTISLPSRMYILVRKVENKLILENPADTDTLLKIKNVM
jgi:hypothetical protein